MNIIGKEPGEFKVCIVCMASDVNVSKQQQYTGYVNSHYYYI